MDDGAAAVKGAVRCHPQYERRGYYKRFAQAVDVYVRATHAHITIWKYTAFWSDYQKTAIDELKKFGTLLNLMTRVSTSTANTQIGCSYD